MKGDTESRLPLRVTSAKVAQLLRQVQNVQMLRHFMRPQGSTVSAFASAFELSHLKAYRQVKTFEDLGLLQVVQQEARAGRAVRWYRCMHQQFFLPAEWVSLEEYLHDSFQPYEGMIKSQLAKAIQEGPHAVAGLLVGAAGQEGVVLVPANAQGQPWSPDFPHAPAVYFGIGPLHLSYQQAKALQHEMTELFDKYRNMQGAGRYVFQALLTPFSPS